MNWLRRNYKTILLVTGEIASFAWTAIALVLDLIGVIPEPAKLRLSALIGFLIFALLIYCHVFSLRRRLYPRLDLVFEDLPSCVHRFRRNGHSLTLFRVGLMNLGGTTIEDVRVSLEALEPQTITFGPIRLLFMHQRQDNEQFRLHPGTRPSLFVDVVQDAIVGDPPVRVFALQYAVTGVRNSITPGNYRITLLAEGQDVQPSRKSFQITWDGEQIGFIEEDVDS